ncbi:NAD(P)-dependent oxidoreductase [Archangium primigenium]|uniref:NAD(P)-dependent oxidoreductase n=1 Tax=[Archangium] primigenium TaxID=2792470 RepID=UPI001958843F|nr:SDR family oxidoreductase [Archangium primigenium]MBM7115049.1 SDR family oxidoreductase [Archangium primigenium]
MKLLVIGATRGTGKHVVDQALERGHEVTVLVRDPAKLQASPKLRVVQGDGRNLADVEKAVQGQDAVITCIGASQLKTAEFLVSTSARPLVEAMTKHGVKRLLLLSTAGAGDSAGMMKWVFPLIRLLARPVYQTIFEDKDRAEAIISATGLDWTLVRPPRLTDEPRVGRYQTKPSQGGGGFAKISRADLATFMIDEAEKGQWIRGAPFVWT